MITDNKKFKNFIAGQWLSAQDYLENINPSDISDTVGWFAQADIDTLDKALESAAKAHQQWKSTGLEARYSVLIAIGEELMQRADELGRLLSREEGKPLAEGRGEVYRSGQFFTYYAGEVLRQIGDTADSVVDNIEIDIRREPIGTVAVITPWNFPMAIAAWKIAPALAFGNAVIWKPASLVPASAIALVEIIAKQQIPNGLVNLLMCSSDSTGKALIESSDIQAVTFTGSVDAGRHIASSCAGNFTKVQLEMGSKNALLVMDDCDLDLAVSCALNGAFGSSGQKCTASSRLIVHYAVHDRFVELLAKEACDMKVGHALDEETQLGPVVSEQQLKANLANLKLAINEGGELICGGEQVERQTKGYFMSPAVLTNTQNYWQVNQEELFAPIACVIKVDDYQQGLNLVNSTRFGLSSAIVTRSLAMATDFRRKVKAGCVKINLPTTGADYHVPFGGRGESGYGPREQGKYAREFYTEVKTSYINSGSI